MPCCRARPAAGVVVSCVTNPGASIKSEGICFKKNVFAAEQNRLMCAPPRVVEAASGKIDPRACVHRRVVAKTNMANASRLVPGGHLEGARAHGPGAH